MLRPALASVLLGACASGGPVSVDVTSDVPDRLSRMRLLSFEDDVAYNDGVVPYDLSMPLFSDYATKRRAIWLPEGETLSWQDDAPLDFPVGSVIVKSFLFPADLRRPNEDLTIVETRVLRHEPDGWDAYPYVWNDRQTEAFLQVEGEVRDVSVVGLDGERLDFAYLVPQKNQCAECHERRDLDGRRAMLPIGPRARYLNGEGPEGVDNQLTHLSDLGLLPDLPPLDGVAKAMDEAEVAARGVDDLDPDELERATRDYLDSNCAHCHDPRGTNGVTSQLFLNWDNEDDFHLGVCKKPGSAGKGGRDRDYDIVPGDHDASILHYRMVTEDLGAMMPQIGRGLTHQLGADLVAAWIDAMHADDCQ